MNDTAIQIELKTFRSPATAVAAVLYALAAVCGLGGAVLLLDPGSREALTKDLILSGILERDAISSWQLIHIVIGLLAFLCPAVMALGMGLTLKGRVHLGMDLLHRLAVVLHWGVMGSGCAAVGVLIFRLVRYIVLCAGVNGGAYLLYTMVLSEAIMGVQAFLLYKLLVRFLRSARECAAAIGYTLSSSKLDRTTYPAFAATGFLILAVFCIVVSADRLFTLTIVDSFPKDYYAVLVSKDLIQLLTGSALGLCGIGNILMFAYLRRFKRTAERIIYAERRKTLGKDI